MQRKFTHKEDNPSITTVRGVFWLQIEANSYISFIRINTHISFPSYTPLSTWLFPGRKAPNSTRNLSSKVPEKMATLSKQGNTGASKRSTHHLRNWKTCLYVIQTLPVSGLWFSKCQGNNHGIPGTQNVY